jgi:hypothetical protein
MASPDSPDAAPRHDSVGAELESMRQIARALEALDDDDTRRRVLRWALDRYRSVAPMASTSQAPVLPPTRAANASADPTLSVDTLADLFPSDASGSTTGAAATRDVESLIKEFAADFRRFALEWQGT